MKRNRFGPGEKGLSGVSHASLGFYTVWTVHLGRRYGILGALSRGNAMKARAIARACGLHEPAVRAWCDAAHSLGLVVRGKDGYRLTPEMRRLLVDEDDIRFLGGQFSYVALRSLDFEALDDLFRRGAVTAAGVRHLREASEEATRWDHTSFLGFLLPREPALASRLAAGARVLDVGCGTGGWVLRMARAFPRSTFLGIDPDRTAIRIAQGRAKATVATGRVRFGVGSGGNPTRESGSFDLAYLGEVLYGVRKKVRILRSCRSALTRHGCLVLAEGLVTPARKAGDLGARLVDAMSLDFALQGSRFFKRSELDGLLQEAGFRDVRFHDAGGGLWFVVATADSKRSVAERSGAARHPRGDR